MQEVADFAALPWYSVQSAVPWGCARAIALRPESLASHEHSKINVMRGCACQQSLARVWRIGRLQVVLTALVGLSERSVSLRFTHLRSPATCLASCFFLSSMLLRLFMSHACRGRDDTSEQ